VAGGIAALAVAGAGGAVAATQWSPKAENEAVLEERRRELLGAWDAFERAQRFWR